MVVSVVVFKSKECLPDFQIHFELCNWQHTSLWQRNALTNAHEKSYFIDQKRKTTMGPIPVKNSFHITIAFCLINAYTHISSHDGLSKLHIPKSGSRPLIYLPR